MQLARITTLLAIFYAAALLALIAGCGEAPPTNVISTADAIGDSAETSPAATPGTAAPAGAIPVPVKQANLKPGTRTVVLDRAGDKPYDKTFDDLRFDMTIGDEFKREMLPPEIEKLKDQRVRIRGYMLPTAQAKGLKVFVLVRDNQVCCFGPGAALYDCILVEMQPGKTANYDIWPKTVEGVFDIQEVRGPDGKHLAIYHLEADSAK